VEPAIQKSVALRQHSRTKNKAYCAILFNVAMRLYDGALRSYMAVVGGVDLFLDTYVVVMVARHT
jgi:hypothetical protein